MSTAALPPAMALLRKPLVQGAVGAVLVAAVTLLLPEPARLPLLAGLLWLTVGIYVGMALMDRPGQVRVQALGGLPVAALALLGLRWPWLVAVGWLVHPAWDLLHHADVVRTRIHPVVVPFCISFDVLVAGLAAYVALG